MSPAFFSSRAGKVEPFRFLPDLVRLSDSLPKRTLGNGPWTGSGREKTV